MKNTIQLYIDEDKKIKGYPITSHDRVIDENGVSIKKRLKNNVKFDIVGTAEDVSDIDGVYDDAELREEIKIINEDLIDIKLDEKKLNGVVKKIAEKLESVANVGTTVEVLERVTREEISRQINDGTIAHLTIQDRTITSEKIQRGAILLEHESWLDVVKLNLVDPSTINANKFLNANGSLQVSPSGSLHTTDYIMVEAGKNYFAGNTKIGYFYDIDKNPISALPNNHTNPFTVPEKAVYFRKTFGTNENKIICEGDTLIDPNAAFGDCKLSFTNEHLKQLLIETIGNTTKVEDNSVTSAMIKKGAITLEHQSWLKINRMNLFNIDTATIGKYLNEKGQVLDSPSGTLMHSDYIEVEECKKYCNSNNSRVICFYNSEKTFVSALKGGDYTNPFTIPEGVKYLRIVYNKSDIKVLCDGDKIIDPNATFGQYSLSWNNEELKNLIKETSTDGVCTSGLNMMVFGDSIAATASMNDDGSNYREVSTNWPTYTKESLKVTGFKNFGRSGAAYRYRSDVEFRQSMTNQVQLAIDTNTQADIIVLSAGTNDWEAHMGTFEEAMSKKSLNELDLTKTYEAIRWCFWKIKEHYPNAICFVATPIQRADTEPFYKIIEAIQKMAERYNFIIIPAHSESGIIREFETQGKPGRWLYDGLHPGDSGKKMMGKLYTRVILNALQNYI